jgi:hypothetical protein
MKISEKEIDYDIKEIFNHKYLIYNLIKYNNTCS